MKIRYILTVLLTMYTCAICAQSTGKRDTVFLLREKRTTGYHAVFIDTNPASGYYKAISDFSFTGDDKKIYANTLALVKDKRLTRFTSKEFPRRWIQVYQHKEKFYVYHPSDFMYHSMVRVTDSTYIDYCGEGPLANRIISFSKVDSTTYRFTLKSPYTGIHKVVVHIIDPKRGIAVFEESVETGEKYYNLMVTADKVRGLPVVVNYSPDQKEVEFDFDEPDYWKLVEPTSRRRRSVGP
ncbi:hypothetical protein L3C95_12670 [Chitinophaga filiformis]|uniref:hypothetical protein n=1 Tax=Chitinophaga filiformis TaxID=104663 RepID=UPI001F2B2AEE|nr:hypothetical protein [Chitinophaga filiformis]MCF6403736.1 hypothetical protein [Chitinophaga filiformis]